MAFGKINHVKIYRIVKKYGTWSHRIKLIDTKR
jgi:hypothetical protein